MNSLIVAGSAVLLVAWGLSLPTYLAWRRRQLSVASTVNFSAMDKQFAKEAIHEALRCLGYVLHPIYENDAEALRQGYSEVARGSTGAQLAASAMALGMVAHYTSSKRMPDEFTLALTKHVSELFSSEFRLEGEKHWDARGDALKGNTDLRAVLDHVARRGFSSSRDAKEEGPLRSALLTLLEKPSNDVPLAARGD